MVFPRFFVTLNWTFRVQSEQKTYFIARLHDRLQRWTNLLYVHPSDCACTHQVDGIATRSKKLLVTRCYATSSDALCYW